MARFVAAWEGADVGALVELLTDDVFMSMPPMPFEYQGRDLVARFCASIFAGGRRFDLVPARANGQPAFAVYSRRPDGVYRAHEVLVPAVTATGIARIVVFLDPSLVTMFGLTQELEP